MKETDIITYNMAEASKNKCVRTTVYLPVRLYEEVKIMAVLTHSNISKLVRVALVEKIKSLKEMR